MRLWTFLTRPRALNGQPTQHRRRGSRSGIALLMAIVTVALVSVIVTEVSYDSRVRSLKAYHMRDQVAAQNLAESGAHLYRLILVADRQIDSALGDMMGGGAAGLWQMVPVINTGLLRFMFVSGGSVDDQEAEAFREQGMTEEMREESREESRFSDKGFLDFDGDFAASVKPLDNRINVNTLATSNSCPLRTCPNLEALQQDATAQMIFGLMSGAENDQWFYDNNIDRWELISNLADWMDPDTTRLYRGGYEDSLYNTLDSPYLAKNAPFDTVDEIRLVSGWDDRVLERFGDQLTVFGGNQINVNQASDEVLFALLRSHLDGVLTDDDFVDIKKRMDEGPLMFGDWGKPKEFVGWVANNVKYPIRDEKAFIAAIKTESDVFIVESTGMVATSVADLTVVYDFSRSKKVGRIQYWRMN